MVPLYHRHGQIPATTHVPHSLVAGSYCTGQVMVNATRSSTRDPRALPPWSWHLVPTAQHSADVRPARHSTLVTACATRSTAPALALVASTLHLSSSMYHSFMVLKYKLKRLGFNFKYLRAYEKNMSYVKLSECLETQNVNWDSVFSDFLKCQQQFSCLNLGYGGLLQQ